MVFSIDIKNCDHLPLTDILEFIVDNRGKTVPTSETGIPLIATNCIKNSELYPVFEKIRYVSEETYKTWFRSHPKAGDIIFVNKGTPGRVCMVPDPVNFCIAQDMMAFRVKTEKIYNKYLFAVLRSPQFQAQISNYHVGTLIPHFKKGDLDKLIIPIPAKEVQRYIGDLYFSFSYKIEVNNQINKTLEEMAQTIFKRWFVDFEFPNEDGEPYKSSGGEMVESELGLIPKGWEVVSVSDLVDSISVKHSFEKDKLIFLNTSDIFNGEVLHNNYSAVETLPGQAKKSINKGDILYSEIRPKNKHFAFIDFEAEDYVVSTKLMVLRSRLDMINEFVYFLLTNDLTVNKLQVLAESRSGTFPQITFKNMNDIKLAFPVNYATVNMLIFKKALEKISHLKKENRSLINLRDTLLPKLMTGEIRVPIK